MRVALTTIHQNIHDSPAAMGSTLQKYPQTSFLLILEGDGSALFEMALYPVLIEIVISRESRGGRADPHHLFVDKYFEMSPKLENNLPPPEEKKLAPTSSDPVSAAGYTSPFMAL